MLTELTRSLRKRGIAKTFHAAVFAERCRRAVRGKHGLEIGGPSELFRRAVPVYGVARSLDNCVFSPDTFWGNVSDDSDPYTRNRVMDAVELAEVRDGEYDFILSCHSLEHIANPVKALQNWKRVAPGYLVLILPCGPMTFDHRRPITTLVHMIEDFKRDIKEDDLSHLQEVIDLTDFTRCELPEGMTVDEEAKRVENLLNNPRNRFMHHHVFDEQNSSELVSFCEYRILAKQIAAGSVFMLAKT